jgi:hypothetical protein
VKSLHSLKRGNTKINIISDLKFKFAAFGIIITLLAWLSGLQKVTDYVYLLFCNTEMIRSKNLTVFGFKLVKRCAASMTVKGFKRCHLQANLITIVVGKLRKWKAIFPVGPIGQDTSVKHILQDLVYSQFVRRSWGDRLCWTIVGCPKLHVSSSRIWRSTKSLDLKLFSSELHADLQFGIRTDRLVELSCK